MRIRPVVNGVRQDFSPKRFLLRLNQDLDKTLQRIDGKQFDRFRFNQSHCRLGMARQIVGTTPGPAA